MNLVPMLMRERRLLLLCAVSIALHLLVLGLIAATIRRTDSAQPAPSIAVTLLPAAPASPPTPVASQAPAPPKPLPAIAEQRAPAPAVATEPAPTTPAAAEQAAPVAPVAGAGWNALAAGQGDALVQMPGRYRVHLPPSTLLSFELTRNSAGEAPLPAGAALIDWRIGADGYSLRVEGVGGALYSKGLVGDAGMAPVSASETLADGALAITRFDEQARRIEFSGSARSYRLLNGSQDRASLLMQLAGMGVAEPDQIKDVLEFYVGAGVDAGIVRFQVLGPELLDSALGKLASVHLAQLTEPGQARLEIWLAPDHHWLPVQLRVTAADGSVLTQLVSAISER
jgi:hypothetical protein